MQFRTQIILMLLPKIFFLRVILNMWLITFIVFMCFNTITGNFKWAQNSVSCNYLIENSTYLYPVFKILHIIMFSRHKKWIASYTFVVTHLPHLVPLTFNTRCRKTYNKIVRLIVMVINYKTNKIRRSMR